MSIKRDRLLLEIRRARLPFALLAGLVAVTAVAGWVIFHNLSFQRPWERYREVHAAFDDVKGVAPGKQPVRISGVQVGVVKGWAVRDGHAVLTLSIEHRFGPIYRDARMRLRPATPLQDMYVEVVRGTPAAGELRAGDVLRAARTETPVDVSRVLQAFDPPTRERLTSLLVGLGRGLDDRGAQLRAAFVRLAPFLTTARRLGSALAQRRRSTARLVSNAARLGETLADREQRVGALLRDGNVTLDRLAAHDRRLDGTLRELAPTLGTIDRTFAAVQAAEADLDPALRALRPTTRSLRPGLVALREFSRAARPALVALRPAVGALRPLARTLVPTSAAALGTVQELRPSAPRLDRITQRVVPCLTAVSRFFQWTPSVIKFGDANGANPRADLSIGYDSLDGQLRDPNQVRTASCTDAKGYPTP